MTERKWTPVIATDYMEANIVEGDGNILATLFMDDRTPENAHLIAAAPDLYEALSRMLSDAVSDGRDWCCMGDARAALAKARGEA